MPVTESANQSMWPLQLVQRALPVTSAESLLSCLVDAWLNGTGVTACHVSLVTERQLSCSFANPARFDQPQFSSIEITKGAINEWSAAQASESLASFAIDESSDLTSVTVVPFDFNGRTQGGVLLLGDVQNTDVFTSLATISGQLIEQLCHVLTSTNGLDPASARQLRDIKLEAMAEFAAGAGHEINNPVATIAGRSALLLKSETDPERRRILETIGGQAYRIRDMIGDAMTYARPPEPTAEEFNPAVDILQISQNLREQFADKQATIEMSLDETITLIADREQFRVVASCLIKNSLEAIDTDGLIGIELGLTTGSEADGSQPARGLIRFAVSDNGVGLNAIEREHLFDPFYSGRQAGRGLGFGLSKCWQILRLHKGTVEAIESPSDSVYNGLTIESLWPA